MTEFEKAVYQIYESIWEGPVAAVDAKKKAAELYEIAKRELSKENKPKVIEEQGDDINVFESGDLIYVYGDKDYWPAILRLPEGFGGKDCFECDMVVRKNDEWTTEGLNRHVDVYPSMRCRKANEQEVEIFGNYYPLRAADLPYSYVLRSIDIVTCRCPNCGAMVELSGHEEIITMPDGTKGVEAWCPECECDFYAKED